jgi:hypothetical protein
MTSLSASESRSKLRVVRVRLLKALKPILSVPKKSFSVRTIAPLTQPCPAGWSGNGGLASGEPNCGVAGSNSGVHAGSASVAGFTVVRSLADRHHRAPEFPVILAVPAPDRAVGRGQVHHGEETGVVGDAQAVACR